jgi:CheY-like chemotaxis protein/HPt (histidine-containing phosphotransfer) domain-containing protein
MMQRDVADTPRNAPQAGVRAAHLLVTGDISPALLAITGLLEDLGHTYSIAGNGFEALAVLRRTSFAAVLMTCQMSEMDGYQATRAIRAGAGGNRRIPVIAMAASDAGTERAKCLAVGMDDLLATPVDARSLQTALEHWVPVVGIDGIPVAPTVDRREVLDHARLDVLHAMTTANGSLRDRIIESFLVTAPEALTLLLAAAAARSDPDLVRAAHWLKGSALTVGAPRVAAACEGMELPEVARDWEATAADVALLAREMDRAMAALRAVPA